MARNKGFDTATGEYYIKIFAVTNLKVVPRVMAHYCKHDNSATTAAYNPHKWEGSVEIFSYAEKYKKISSRVVGKISENLGLLCL